MQSSERPKLPAPPGLVASLTAGFDAVASHVAVIILPILLDLLLWLGPHLYLKDIMQPVLAQMASVQLPLTSGMPDATTLQQFWNSFLGQFNLLSFLRTYPVGITSLMAISMPIKTPFGLPFDLEFRSLSMLLGVSISLLVVGLVSGTIYLQQVAHITNPVAANQPNNRSWFQAILVSLIWIVVFMILVPPLLFLFTFLALVSPVLAQIGMIIILLLAVWVLAPVFFSPHGVFVFGQNAPASIMQSLHMMRFSLPTSGMFLVVSLLINEGLNYLWRLPPDNSWLTLIGIAGHAFISTALLAASFFYYRNINAWLKTVFEQVSARKITG